MHEAGNVVRDKNGKPLRMLGSVRDISKQKESELRFKRILQELKYQKYALDQPSIVAITDTQGKLIYSNHQFALISGYTTS